MPREHFWHGEVILSQLEIRKLTHRSSISNKQQQSLILPSIFPSISTFHPGCHTTLLSPWNYIHWSIGSAPKCTEASCTLLLFLRHSCDQGTAGHNPAQKPNKQNKQTTRLTNIWHQPILRHTNKQKRSIQEKQFQNDSVRILENLLIHKINKNTGKFVKINSFRTMKINQRLATIKQ